MIILFMVGSQGTPPPLPGGRGAGVFTPSQLFCLISENPLPPTRKVLRKTQIFPDEGKSEIFPQGKSEIFPRLGKSEIFPQVKSEIFPRLGKSQIFPEGNFQIFPSGKISDFP